MRGLFDTKPLFSCFTDACQTPLTSCYDGTAFNFDGGLLGMDYQLIVHAHRLYLFDVNIFSRCSNEGISITFRLTHGSNPEILEKLLIAHCRIRFV